MSEADQTIEEARQQFSHGARIILNMVRRMAVTVTSRPFWQVVGNLLLDNVTKETRNAEPFTGIGFYSRPAANSNPEAIVVNIGGAAENPVIIATRDEKTRAKFANINQDETIVFNSRVSVLLTKDDKVAITAHNITGLRNLAFQDELNDLRFWVMEQFSGPGHTHTLSSGGVTTSVSPHDPVAAPTDDYPGTTVLHTQ
jgi:phage gp45-like